MALVTVLDYEYVDNATRYVVRVTEPLGGASLGDREFIWVDNVCRCPPLDIGDGYVVMGHLQAQAAGPASRESRLQLTDRSVALPADTWQRRFADRHFNCRRR